MVSPACQPAAHAQVALGATDQRDKALSPRAEKVAEDSAGQTLGSNGEIVVHHLQGTGRCHAPGQSGRIRDASAAVVGLRCGSIEDVHGTGPIRTVVAWVAIDARGIASFTRRSHNQVVIGQPNDSSDIQSVRVRGFDISTLNPSVTQVFKQIGRT
ncbi:MAG: hypothetical protein ACI87O_002326 [Planctomycetota bacterium]|jgi:hypothetical protein